MKKKILFVVDYSLSSTNSVGQILRNIIDNLDNCLFEPFIYVVSPEYKYLVNSKEFTNQFSFKNAKDFDNTDVIFKNRFRMSRIGFLKKICNFLHKGETFLNNHIISTNLAIIKKLFKIDFALFLTFSPEVYSYKSKLKYSYFLYDTFLGRPGIKRKLLKIEKKVIKKSISYYIAPFFYNEYSQFYYNYSNIKSLPYPLFPDKKKIVESINNSIKQKYEFSYFGQLQSFRNARDIFSVFEKLKITIDVFSKDKPSHNQYLIYHDPIIGSDYFSAIASSKFLLVFDNNKPYEHYLPSKLYEFIAFGKPIILFTKNKNSAAINFLKDYPLTFYYYLNSKKSIDDFVVFINNSAHLNRFNDEIYSLFEKQYSSSNIVKIIQRDFINANIKKV